MSISDTIFKALRKFGLSGYEIKAYIALLSRGGLTASKVSQESKIPYSKIYEVLSSLEDKGWIESEKARPSRYYPKPPSEAVAISRLRFDDVLNKSGSIIINDLQPIYESKETHERPDIWIVRGEYNILARLQDVCNRASRELLVAIPLIPEVLVKFFQPTFKELKRRRVAVSIMTTKDVDNKLIELLKTSGEVRFRNQMFGGGIISDRKEVLLILSGETDSGDNVAIWSNHAGLTRFARSYFEYLWREASKPQ